MIISNPSNQPDDTLAQLPDPEAEPDRRRPGRLPSPSPTLIALMRHPTLPPERLLLALIREPLAGRLGQEGERRLGPCQGLAVAILLSSVMWAAILLAVKAI